MTVAVTPNLARSNVLVVTGTDTGVGTTWVAAALARTLVAAGRRVVALKVAETGYSSAGADGEDGELLARATGQREPSRALVRLAAPLTPALAAEREGISLDFDDMLLRIEGYAAGMDVALIEGSGGMLSPIAWDWNLVDLVQALEGRALIVAEDRLGVINHTLLTVSALEIAGVPLAGIVLVAPASPDGSTGSNAAAIARLSGADRILALPRMSTAGETPAGLAEITGWL